MGWKPEVQVKGEGGWHRNGLVFATKAEAEANAADLYGRWTLTTAYRAVEVEEAPNYKWEGGRLIALVT